jgi:NAD(P)H dehydrogenase (quinone)
LPDNVKTILTVRSYKAKDTKVHKLSGASVEWADAIVFGTPTRFGAISSELKAYVDGLGGLWAQGKLNGKAGAVFCSTSTQHGGNETTLVSMYNFLAHLGLIIVPTGYADPSLYKAGTPYGASAVSYNQATPP